MTWDIDEERAIEGLATSSLVDLEHGLVTIYAAACVGCDEQHYSHGGTATLDPKEAFDTAMELNRTEPGPCNYLPMGLGIRPQDILVLGRLITGRMMLEEPGGDELGN